MVYCVVYLVVGEIVVGFVIVFYLDWLEVYFIFGWLVVIVVGECFVIVVCLVE